MSKLESLRDLCALAGVAVRKAQQFEETLRGVLDQAERDPGAEKMKGNRELVGERYRELKDIYETITRQLTPEVREGRKESDD